MKVQLEQQLTAALAALKSSGLVPEDCSPDISITRTRDSSHGDFTTNLAMVLAKPAKRAPREIAQALIDNLPASESVSDVQIAGPGFINFFQADDMQAQVVSAVLTQGNAYGRNDVGAGKRVQVEFVSANPTGPLHVGHGRGAALGASIANLLDASGFNVQREYYVNDAGRQMAILAVSVWLRYLELSRESISFPVNGYRGDYIREISQSLLDDIGSKCVHPASTVFESIAPDEPAGGDKEAHIDALIERMKDLLGEVPYERVFDLGLTAILNDIKGDLAEFGVRYDEWFSDEAWSAVLMMSSRSSTRADICMKKTASPGFAQLIMVMTRIGRLFELTVRVLTSPRILPISQINSNVGLTKSSTYLALITTATRHVCLLPVRRWGIRARNWSFC